MSASLALLLDTHILVWISEDNSKLSVALRRAIEQERLFVSAVVAFEYDDLLYRGRFRTMATIAMLQADLEFAVLDFSSDLAGKAAALPKIHRDPVDRMLVAHAAATGMTIATADRDIHRYPVECIE